MYKLIHTYIIDANNLSWIIVQALMPPYANMKALKNVAIEFTIPINE